jgi:hypothetical protein
VKVTSSCRAGLRARHGRSRPTAPRARQESGTATFLSCGPRRLRFGVIRDGACTLRRQLHWYSEQSHRRGINCLSSTRHPVTSRALRALPGTRFSMGVTTPSLDGGPLQMLPASSARSRSNSAVMAITRRTRPVLRWSNLIAPTARNLDSDRRQATAARPRRRPASRAASRVSESRQSFCAMMTSH